MNQKENTRAGRTRGLRLCFFTLHLYIALSTTLRWSPPALAHRLRFQHRTIRSRAPRRPLGKDCCHVAMRFRNILILKITHEGILVMPSTVFLVRRPSTEKSRRGSRSTSRRTLSSSVKSQGKTRRGESQQQAAGQEVSF